MTRHSHAFSLDERERKGEVKREKRRSNGGYCSEEPYGVGRTSCASVLVRYSTRPTLTQGLTIDDSNYQEPRVVTGQFTSG